MVAETRSSKDGTQKEAFGKLLPGDHLDQLAIPWLSAVMTFLISGKMKELNPELFSKMI